MRSCNTDSIASSSCRQHSSLQSLQVRIQRAADLRKRCCCCARRCLHGSTFTTVPHVRNLGHGGPPQAAAVENVGLTSPSPSSSQRPTKQITWTQHQQPVSKQIHQQQHASKGKSASGAAPQRKSSRTNPPHKANLHQHLRSAGSTEVSKDTAAASKDAGIELRLSQLEIAYKKHDPGSCHQAVQQLKLLVEGMSADHLLAGTSVTTLKAWCRKLNQDAKANDSRNSAWQSSATPVHVNGDQQLGNAKSLSTSAAPPLSPNQEQLHATLLYTAQEMQPAQRIDLFLHRYHPKLVQLWLARGHQNWAQEYIAMLPPVLPTATYNSFVASCDKYHSVKTLDVVLEVCEHHSMATAEGQQFCAGCCSI